MDEDKLTEEEKSLLKEMDREISELESSAEGFKEKTGEQIAQIKEGIQAQEKDLDSLEVDMASWEEENKDEIDSLAIKSATEGLEE